MGTGNGRREINKEYSKIPEYLEFLKRIPNDQYACIECNNVPEIMSIDLNKFEITFNCKEHKIKKIPIKQYIDEQSKHLYYNNICDGDKTMQRDSKDIFKYCFLCNKNYCNNCIKNDDKTHSKYWFNANDINSICDEHYQYCTLFCKNCNKNKCQSCVINKKHKVIKIQSTSKKEDIAQLENQRQLLIKKKENIDYLIKLIEIILETKKKHIYNYFHNINITNIVNSIKKCEEINLNNEQKLKNIENKILQYLNNKYETNLKIDEKELNLSGLNIESNDYQLFSLINFPNLESINLRNNEFSDINLLNNFNLQDIKVIELSNNNIEDLKSLKNISENAKKLERLFLSNNKIKNVDILKDNLFKFLKEIKLEDNQISEKEKLEVYSLINDEKYSNIFTLFYIIDEDEYCNENKIRIFGDSFVINNKRNCKLLINKKETELTNFYYYKDDEKELCIKLIKTGNVTDMSYMFSRCFSLNALPDISNWDTSNVKNMSSMFLNCKKLEELDDISKWDTSKVTNMQNMFGNCISLSNLPPIEKWNTNNVTNFDGMFEGCNTIIIPDIYLDK